MWQVTPERFDLSVASGTLGRIDNFIIRRDDTNRDMYPMIQTGSFSTNPTPPSLVREGAIFDIKLAEINIKAGTIVINQVDITDTRMNASVCGWVASTVTEIDFSQISAQFNDFFTQYQATAAARYKLFLSILHGYEDDAVIDYDDYTIALNTLKQSANNAFFQWFSPFKTTKEMEFNEWFQSLVDTLDGDQAANLFNLIDQHKRASIASEAGVHGLRYWNGALQVNDNGWIHLIGAVIGYRWLYIDGLDLTWQAWDMNNYSWRDFENLIEKEAA